MNHPKQFKRSLIIIMSLISFLFGEVTLPKIFSDNMILQRDMAIPVWGKADAGSKITVTLNSNKLSTLADENGKWMVRLPQMTAGGPYELMVSDEDTVFQFQNVLIGDVWLASGQSNMEWQVQQAKNAEMEIKSANYPNIRLFNVPHDKKLEPQDDILGGEWQVCDTNSVKTASAVAYFFARELHEDQNIPIGILQTTWGGTPVEAWTSRDMLISDDISREIALASDTLTYGDFVQDSLDLENFWKIVYNPQKDIEQSVIAENFDDSKWTQVKMPKTMSDMKIGDYEGIVWMRKKVKLSETMIGKELTINLGHPELNYSIYVNGKQICKKVWNAAESHSFTIPADLMKAGENIVAARVAFLWGGGGFNPPADHMYITDGSTKISLAGKWLYKMDLEDKIKKVQYQPHYPTALYNAMIHPLIPFGIKGFIWYQGEENVGDAYNYRYYFANMIRDWRIRWQQGYLPFLYVQLANYMKVQSEPSESDWAMLRESQTHTLNQPNTGMACIIDLGEAESIHPLNKQDVGKRLALQAEKLVYGKDIQASGPMFESMCVYGNEVTITFSEIGSGLEVRDSSELTGFAIASKDRKFYWAKGRIEEGKVIIQSDKVKNPVAVRYAWADNPVCNLINQEGLPAVPFRTDEWEK